MGLGLMLWMGQINAQVYRQSSIQPRYRVFSQSTEKPEVAIYVLAGQSNCVGRDTIPNLSTSFAYLLDTLPPQIRITNDGRAIDRLVMDREATNFNGGQKGDVKPETAFADTLFKVQPHEFVIYKYAIGATQLTQSSAIPDWNANSQGEYFDELLLGLVRLQDKIYLEGKIPVVKAFFGCRGNRMEVHQMMRCTKPT